MRENLGSGAGTLVWKSDAQGHDQIIIGDTPWDIWSRVQVALVEMWRIQRTDQIMAEFRARIDIFPYKSLGIDRPTTTDEAMAYLAASDWAHDDLVLWR